MTQSARRLSGAESFSLLISSACRRAKTSVTEETWSWHSWSITASSARLSSWAGSASRARHCWNLALESEFPITSAPGGCGSLLALPEDNVLNRAVAVLSSRQTDSLVTV